MTGELSAPTVTEMCTVPGTDRGAVVVICVSEMEIMGADVGPNFISVAPVNPVPVMVIDSPPDADP